MNPYVNKLDNLEEMNKLLEMYNLPKWVMKKKKKDNLKSMITGSEIESVILKNSLQIIVQVWMASLGNFTKYTKKKFILVLLALF